MTISYHADSDSGLNKHKLEDAYFANETKTLFIICDGMGRIAGGKIASNIAIKSVVEYWDQHEVENLDLNNDEWTDKVKVHIEKAVQFACKNIFDKSKEKDIWNGMGASMLVASIKGNTAVIGHIGDCRCYIVTGNSPHLLTIDHTMEKEMLQAGLLKNDQIGKTMYSKVLTRSVGTHESVLVDLLDVELKNNDYLTLFTNGIHKYFKTDKDIFESLTSKDLRFAVSKFIFNANQRGGQDDMTAMVLNFKSEKKEFSKLNQQKMEIIFKLPFWQKTSFRKANILKNYIKTNELNKGESLDVANIDKGLLIYVIEGAIEIVEENKTTKIISSNGYFGEKGLITKPKNKIIYRAQKETKIFYLSRISFQKLCKKHPKAGFYFLKKLSENIINFEEKP